MGKVESVKICCLTPVSADRNTGCASGYAFRDQPESVKQADAIRRCFTTLVGVSKIEDVRKLAPGKLKARAYRESKLRLLERHVETAHMGLAISCNYLGRTVLMWDMRMVYPDGTEETARDIAPIMAAFPGSGFVIAFIGLAQIGNKQTDVWVRDRLSQRSMAKMSVDEKMSDIVDALTERFSQLPFPNKIKRLTLVIAGFQGNVPFIGTISNQETDKFDTLPVPQKQFRVLFRHPGPKASPDTFGWITLHGADRKVRKAVCEKAEALGRDKFKGSLRDVYTGLLELHHAARISRGENASGGIFRSMVMTFEGRAISKTWSSEKLTEDAAEVHLVGRTKYDLDGKIVVRGGAVDHEKLFLETMGDLRRLKTESTDYSMLRAAALLRQLFLESSPLVHRVNRHHRIKLMFPVYGRDQLNQLLPLADETFAWEFHEPFSSKTEKPHLLSLDDFLRMQMGKANKVPFTVKDVILTLAHIMGGVHVGKPSEHVQTEILSYFQRIEGRRSLTPMTIVPIIGVVLAGLAPLVSIVDEARFRESKESGRSKPGHSS